MTELSKDYENLIGDGELPTSLEAIRDLLQNMKGVRVEKDENGTEFWSYSKDGTQNPVNNRRMSRRRTRNNRGSSRRENEPVSSRIKARRAPILNKKYVRKLFYFQFELGLIKIIF